MSTVTAPARTVLCLHDCGLNRREDRREFAVRTQDKAFVADIHTEPEGRPLARQMMNGPRLLSALAALTQAAETGKPVPKNSAALVAARSALQAARGKS
jgi:hypothetical protein